MAKNKGGRPTKAVQEQRDIFAELMLERHLSGVKISQMMVELRYSRDRVYRLIHRAKTLRERKLLAEVNSKMLARRRALDAECFARAERKRKKKLREVQKKIILSARSIYHD